VCVQDVIGSDQDVTSGANSGCKGCGQGCPLVVQVYCTVDEGNDRAKIVVATMSLSSDLAADSILLGGEGKGGKLAATEGILGGQC